MSIDLSSLPAPQILDVLDFDTIKARNIAQLLTLAPSWQPHESDEYMPVIEAFSYREMAFQAKLNDAVKALFVMYAVGPDLDNIVVSRAGLTRLPGGFPTASVTFTLSAALPVDLTIPATIPGGTPFHDINGGTHTAYLTADVLIPAGSTTGIGTLELQEAVASSTVRCEVSATLIPYISTVTQAFDFVGGADPETDAQYRTRYFDSLTQRSTAGAASTYSYYIRSADTRVQDFTLSSPSPGLVNISYYVDTTAMDATTAAAVLADVSAHIIAALATDANIRPLTDTVDAVPATASWYTVTAQIKADPAVNALDTLNAAIASLSAKLRSLAVIGGTVYLAQIIAALMVPGVVDVILTAPTADVVISDLLHVPIPGDAGHPWAVTVTLA